MKKIKYFAFAVAMLMLCMSVVSCGSASKKVETTFTVSLVLNDAPYIDGYTYTIKRSEDDPATILDAVREALQAVDVETTIDESGFLANVIVDGTVYANFATEEEYVYSWIYTVDGQSAPGKASDVQIKEGWHIIYTYTKAPLEEE
ncbi:MAG: DUF4430 domain-containing protein [Ruminococcaceae bacterium]|nr:DUF4430 domain-containing protein [Oscillospiraceae bacterium]